MAQRRALVKDTEETAVKRATTDPRAIRAKKQSFSVAVTCDVTGTYEIAFSGTMTKQFLKKNRMSVNGIDNKHVERAFINMMEVGQIDEDGIDLLLRVMRKIDKAGIRFQLMYNDGQVGSMIESSGLLSYFARPTWIYG